MDYYTCLEAMLKRYDRIGKSHAFCADTAEELHRWKRAAWDKLLEVTGIGLCRLTDPKARRLTERDMEFYRKESWIIQTEPDVWMPFYLLRPMGVGPDKKCPAVIIPHGHGPGGKEAVLAEDNGPALAVQMVRKGYYVFCPDGRGYGERREYPQQGDTPESWGSNSHREIMQMALGFGQSLIGLMVWDLMKLVDFIQSLDSIDPSRIGCAGMSGGGQQTLWLAALDERIRAASVSGYFYGMKESLLELPQNCSCNYVPGMWGVMDMGDLGAMIAPRPLHIESGEQDPLNGKSGMGNVRSQVETAARAYAITECSEKLVHCTHPGGHEWRGTGMLGFFEKYL